jgi:cytochrome P450
MLDAVINETMRLYPPVQSGVGRQTSPQGVTVQTENGPVYIPGNVAISIPTLTLQRDPRYFSPHPNAFRPDRWLYPEKEEAFNKDAFIPFAYGAASCVGKALAWMEMRLFLARLVQQYTFTPAPGFDYDNYPLCIRDRMTMARTVQLNVVLKRRAKSI